MIMIINYTLIILIQIHYLFTNLKYVKESFPPFYINVIIKIILEQLIIMLIKFLNSEKEFLYLIQN